MVHQDVRAGSLLWVVITSSLLLSANAEENTVVSSSESSTSTQNSKVRSGGRQLICPDASAGNLPIFTLPCKSDADCAVLGEQCCEEAGKFKCRSGVPKPHPEPKHSPFLGFIPRVCPKEPIAESLAVKNCTTDRECWPRICCPDGAGNYCRTSAPQWERVPRLSALKNVVAYMQCTPPPPPLFDLFPKPCRTTIDCFPNLCCQEQYKKICRPPKKSILALIASIAQV